MVQTKTEYGMPTLSIKYKGYFDPNKLLLFIRDWLLEEHYKFEEKKHKASGSAIKVNASGSRKLNEYVKYTLTVNVVADEIKPIELVQEGKKIKSYEGRVTVTLGGSMNLDWQKRFGGSRLLQFLQEFFHRYIIKQKIEDEWEGPLKMKIFVFRDDIKKQLGLD